MAYFMTIMLTLLYVKRRSFILFSDVNKQRIP
jgi:hypothetical protein